jgi:hypothetical protein
MTVASADEMTATASPGGWFRCQVLRTGPNEDGNIGMLLTDFNGAFTNRWFGANAQIRKETLATALAAVSTGFPVDVMLSSADEFSVVNRCYLLKP